MAQTGKNLPAIQAWVQSLGQEDPLGMEIPHDPAILLVDIYPKRTKTLILKNICTPMSIAALFTIASVWKQHKSLQVDEWTMKTRYMCM